MRTVRLKTVHVCRQLRCPTCATVEGAFRRALALAGYRFPDQRPPRQRSPSMSAVGPPQDPLPTRPSAEAYVSPELTIELIHETDQHALVPHVELTVDEEQIVLPRGGNARSLQELFAKAIEGQEQAAPAS